jgi:cystathionine beta-lyase/cystathionine gamma-synthase
MTVLSAVNELGVSPVLTVSLASNLLIPNEAYAGTHRLVSQVHATAGINFSVVATHDLGSIEAAIRPETRMIWVETPTNPLQQINDIGAVADLAHRHDALLAVDNYQDVASRV